MYRSVFINTSERATDKVNVVRTDTQHCLIETQETWCVNVRIGITSHLRIIHFIEYVKNSRGERGMGAKQEERKKRYPLHLTEEGRSMPSTPGPGIVHD